jgi:hypothetical protein
MQHRYNPSKVWPSKSRTSTRNPVKRRTEHKFFDRFKLKAVFANIKVPQNISFVSKLLGTTNTAKIRENGNQTIQKPGNKDVVYKIFKPKPAEILKENIKKTIPKKNIVDKSHSFGFKNFDQIKGNFRTISTKNTLYQAKYLLAKWHVIERFNQFMIGSLVAVVLFFIVYLSLFDTYFLVKNYNVRFEENSYLSKTEVAKLLGKMKENKFLGFAPSNQLWFLNSENLTLIAKQSNVEVSAVTVNKRNWPNGADITIKTEPILLTLQINDKENWRVSKTGEVTTQDDANVLEKLVVVHKNVTFNQTGKTLQDTPFTNKDNQMRRFLYTNWLWTTLKNKGVEVKKTVYPSIFDSDVFVTTKSGTELRFSSDIGGLGIETQIQKIDSFFGSVESKTEKAGGFAYVDFREPKKLFACPIVESCNERVLEKLQI